MTSDEREEGRHLEAVANESSSDGSSSSSASDSPSGSPDGDDLDSSSEDPPTTDDDARPTSSREDQRSDSSDVESSDSERLRSVSDDSDDSERLRVVDDDERDPVTRERDELRETVQRVQADFENFRKRTMRDQTAQLERATDGLIEQLLPVLDSFELAALNVREGDLDEPSAKLRKGVELVYAELLGVLEKAGLERIDALGQPFDPEQHEAVLREGDGQQVTEVMRTGYRLKGRILRPAMVKVGASDSEGPG